jgi:hypothetical protein
MTKNRHDQFAKQYLKGMLSPFSQEIEISFELPPGEPQQVDVWFIPQSRQPIVRLGSLGKMTIAPSLIEVFRNPMSTEDLFSCVEKLCRVRAEWKRRAKRDNQKIRAKDQPQLWLIVPTASEKTLNGCNAEAKKNWGNGFYFLGDTLRIGFVVVHQLPVSPETLLLRLLGRGEVQRKAIEELLELPQQPLKTFVLEKLTKLKIMLKSRTRLSKEDQETMVNIDALYEEWRIKTLQEGAEAGRQEGVEVGRQEADRVTLEGMLLVKFGQIDPPLESIIPVLLELSAIDRIRAVMQLSREEILRDFGNKS